MFITDFISKVFNAIVDQRNRALEQAQHRDPAYQQMLADVKKSKAELHEWVQGQLKENPELARRYEKINALGETKEATPTSDPAEWIECQHYLALHSWLLQLTRVPIDEEITLTRSFGEAYSAETFGTDRWDQDSADAIAGAVVNGVVALARTAFLSERLMESAATLIGKSREWRIRALEEMVKSVPTKQMTGEAEQFVNDIASAWGIEATQAFGSPELLGLNTDDHTSEDLRFTFTADPPPHTEPRSEGIETNPPYPGAEWTSIVEDCAWPLAHEVAVRCYEEKPVEPGSSKRFSGVRKNFRDCDWINVIFRQKYLSLYIKGVDRDWEGLFDAIGVQPEIRRWRDGVQVRCRTSQEVLAAMNWLELPLSS